MKQSIFVVILFCNIGLSYSFSQDKPVSYNSAINRPVDFSYLSAYYKIDYKTESFYLVNVSLNRLYQLYYNSDTLYKDFSFYISIYNLDTGEKLSTTTILVDKKNVISILLLRGA
jgi:hypothetical protein